MDPVCRYFHNGYCKFGECCRKQHNKEVCSIQHCDSKECNNRHPKACKYFIFHQFCKFGEKCAYLHNISKSQINIHELNEKVQILEGSIKLLTKQIEELAKELEISKTMKNSTDSLMCDKCEYTNSSNTVFKIHKTMNHQIVVEDNAQKRAEALFCPPPPVVSDLNQHTSQEFETFKNVNNSSYFKCEVCGYTASSSKVLNLHKTMNHKEKEDKNVPCDQCDYIANSAEYLKHHTYLFHTVSEVQFNWLFPL